MAFLALAFVPALAVLSGFSQHVENSKTTRFCLSCHVMEDYGKSLHIDDPLHIPASHFQAARVDREHACFTCHTTYTMYGDINAKLGGLRHVYIQYLGHIPAKIKLRTPYSNRECLHCHDGARSFEEATTHRQDGNLALIKKNELSCIKSGCHDKIHDIEGLKNATFWPTDAK
jgi:nitrate/TMAO reductase-like tetraheme cytochrome c subunit